MLVELGKIRELHGILPAARVQALATAAALALQRGEHSPGVTISWTVGAQRQVPDPEITWEIIDVADLIQYDHNHITEDAAEAIALLLAALHMNWTVKRRIQRGEFADWLLEAEDGQTVAFEVAGTSGHFVGSLLATELDQVKRCVIADLRAACVVALKYPEAVLATV